MPRLFAGLEVPDAVRAQLAALRGGLTGARWIEPTDYHVTLRFAGDVDRHLARDLHEGLAEMRAGSLDLVIDEVEAFGGHKPRALVARMRPSRALLDLHAEHERLARRVGLDPEPRRFTPHVTLARLREVGPMAAADWLQSRALGRPIAFTAERFVLYSARDSVGGGPYLVEAAYPLARVDRGQTAYLESA